MIYIETITLNDKQYKKTYSDTYYIKRDGVEYSEAIDPIDSDRVYTESETLLEDADATEEDYLEAFAELGVIDHEEV